VQVAATSQNVCVVLNDGVLRCWGNDYLGQVGDGRAGSNVNSTMPTTSTLSDVAFVSVGGEHMCAVTHLGAVKCVGANFSGQLGYGLEDYSPTWLTAIASGAVQVACSGNSTCALMADNAVYCWGDNTDGELGDGTNIQRDTPVLVKGF
jgi:alpha-tubulin suppressor-like RCC1 family protein